MPYSLTNYTGVTAPLLGETEPASSGRISGGSAPTVVDAFDGHDHSAGKGAMIPASGINIDDDFELNGHPIVGATRVTFDGDNALPENYSIGFNSGRLAVRDATGNVAEFPNTIPGDVANLCPDARWRGTVTAGAVVQASANGLGAPTPGTGTLGFAFTAVQPNANYTVLAMNQNGGNFRYAVQNQTTVSFALVAFDSAGAVVNWTTTAAHAVSVVVVPG